MTDMHLLLNKIEKFAHVYERIINKWGTHEFRPYVETLLFKDGRYDRQGFPMETFKAITQLRDLHDKKYPHLSTDDSPWDLE